MPKQPLGPRIDSAFFVPWKNGGLCLIHCGLMAVNWPQSPAIHSDSSFDRSSSACQVGPSPLPLIVCGLDRAGEGDDIRREDLNENTVFAWSRPTLGEHAVVEHPEEG